MDVWVTVMRPVGWAQSGVLVSDNSPLTQEKSTFFSALALCQQVLVSKWNE